MLVGPRVRGIVIKLPPIIRAISTKAWLSVSLKRSRRRCAAPKKIKAAAINKSVVPMAIIVPPSLHFPIVSPGGAGSKQKTCRQIVCRFFSGGYSTSALFLIIGNVSILKKVTEHVA
jgi:hypothetical protein